MRNFFNRKNTPYYLEKIRRGRIGYIFRKTLQALWYLLCSPIFLLCIPLVLLVRILRPFILIRFGCILNRRIGHLATNVEVYLCEKEAGIPPQRTFDILYRYSRISCNQQLMKMWSRILRVNQIAFFLQRVNCCLPGSAKHNINGLPPPWARVHDYDTHSLIGRTKQHLYFTAEEEKMGERMLRKLGIPEGVPFISFYGRDPAYLDTAFPITYWDYHDYRDVNIHTYILAVEELTKRGYFVIRMGAFVKEPLRTENPRIIDYATKARSDFLDIFLCAKCHFFIGSTGGLSEVARIFRRPIAWTNYIPLEWVHISSRDNLFIPKKLWLRRERRLMTFAEIFRSGAGGFLDGREYEKLGIEVLENTPQEIKDLVVEMDERLNRIYRTTKEDKVLQERLRRIFKSVVESKEFFFSRIGTEFLRQNKKLLE